MTDPQAPKMSPSPDKFDEVEGHQYNRGGHHPDETPESPIGMRPTPTAQDGDDDVVEGHKFAQNDVPEGPDFTLSQKDDDDPQGPPDLAAL